MTNGQAAQEMISVPFYRKAKQHICFRECVKLMKIAETTGCKIRLVSGKQSGTTDSLLSLLKLGIASGTPLVLSLSGENREKAYHLCMDVLNGEAA